MNTTATDRVDAGHVDVLIVGAGISGIGSAYHLQDQCPEKSYVIVEMKDTFGGTWETHKYPGVRSDSDLYTFGYRFKPWIGPPIASARVTWTCNFLWMCQGYYDHEHPYVPDWPGMDRYRGEFVHAQLWDPEKHDYAGKRVLVIGSGATAATVVPAFAEKAAHVTMLQRSPTYFFCSENRNELADRLREIGIDEPTIHRVVRAQITHDQDVLTRRCQTEPDVVFEELKALIRQYAGEDFEFEPHFVPRYRIWQQRLAFCPEGDLFRAAVEGKLTVVTDTIETFTETGVRTSSGEEIEADLIVACTGFRLSVLGGIPFEVDGKAVDWHETVNYRGMMFTGVPNLLWRGEGPNPYFGILALADYLVVSGDSASMVSEAASTGKPLYVIDFGRYSKRLARFHRELREERVTRPFDGSLASWEYAPVDDTGMVAEAIMERLGKST